MARNKHFSSEFTVRCSPGQKACYEALARQVGLTLSEFVRRTLPNVTIVNDEPRRQLAVRLAQVESALLRVADGLESVGDHGERAAQLARLIEIRHDVWEATRILDGRQI